jgi:hypothetical protein
MGNEAGKLDNDIYSFNIYTLEGKRRLMQRELDRYGARRSMISREDLEALGMDWEGEDLYVPKP